MTLTAVPTLDDIARNPSVLDGVPLHALRALAAQALVVQSAILTAIVSAPVETSKSTGDRLLTADEIAQRMGRKKSWVYQHAAEWPFAILRDGETPRFSLLGFEAWIQNECAMTSRRATRRPDAARRGA